MSRALFPPGQQHQFLQAVQSALGLTWDDLATFSGVTRRAVFDWRQERSAMPYEVVQKLAALSHLPMLALQDIIIEADWRKRAGTLGAQKSQATHGNPGTPEGRSRGGQMVQQRRREQPGLYVWGTTAKHIHEPELSPQLAEMIGIILGDGQFTEHGVNITLNLRREHAYAEFVAQGMSDLFGFSVSPKIQISKVTYLIQASSVRLVDFLKRLGLTPGNKVEQPVRVPDWVLNDLDFTRACTRGLMDTDSGPYPHM